MPQKTTPPLIIFQVLYKTWYLSYLFRLIFLLNLKLHPTITITQCQKRFLESSTEKILSILKGLNTYKAGGVDNLSVKFLKNGVHVLARPISQLSNISIKLNSFPRCCEIAKVKPLFKKGSQNYRPISLLPLLSKIIEGIVHDQTEEFLSNRKPLYRFQSGF